MILQIRLEILDVTYLQERENLISQTGAEAVVL